MYSSTLFCIFAVIKVVPNLNPTKVLKSARFATSKKVLHVCTGQFSPPTKKTLCCCVLVVFLLVFSSPAVLLPSSSAEPAPGSVAYFCLFLSTFAYFCLFLLNFAYFWLLSMQCDTWWAIYTTLCTLPPSFAFLQ